MPHEKKSDPWTKAPVTKRDFFGKWHQNFDGDDHLAECWTSLRGELSQPTWTQWPVRNGVLKLLETEVTDLPKSFAVVSLIYGNSVKALAEGLVLGRSLAGKTTHDCLLMLDAAATCTTRSPSCFGVRRIASIDPA